MDGYDVDVEQLRAHANNIEAIKARFEAVKSASSHIAQDGEAYGLLCGWIAEILEGKHTRQDDLIAKVERNLGLVSTSLQVSADDYESVDESNASNITTAGGGSS